MAAFTYLFILVAVTYDRHQTNNSVGSFLGVFFATSRRYSGAAGLPMIHKKTQTGMPLWVSRMHCAQTHLLVSLSRMLK